MLKVEKPIATPNVRQRRIRVKPVVREIHADLETPISIYMRLANERPSFLLESVTGGEQVARYSFIGVEPSKAYVLRGETLEIYSVNGKVLCERIEVEGDPLELLREELNEYSIEHVPGLPRFIGGLVGYMGYEVVRYFENRLPLAVDDTYPDAIFLLADTLVAFDHAYGKLLLISNAAIDDETGESLREAERKLDDIEERLKQPLRSTEIDEKPSETRELEKQEFTSSMSKEAFEQAVILAKEYIAAGDIFQVVLSQRLTRTTDAAPFNIYRAVRRINPSPYMFYFDFGELPGESPLYLIGASPELHVRLDERQAIVRPIAGTRRRGKNHAEDLFLEKDLLADPKERAEHVMLVDLGRNDLGRVCRYGSVHVPELMVVERYSHVMHIVSQVEGDLEPELDSFDLLRATFPAGTVSGAPKIRAMQIIDELERLPRGAYAGVVGYFSYDGGMDTCIAIRTIVMQDDRVYIQAGAGIVADSVPEKEYEETLNKALVLGEAIEIAEREYKNSKPGGRT